jgi:hypothetical protein
MSNGLNIKKNLISYGFFEILDKLQHHENKLVSEKALNIIDDHITCEDVF